MTRLRMTGFTFNPGVLFTAFWIVLFTWLLMESSDWPIAAQRFPGAIVRAALVLALIQFAWDIYRMVRPSLAEDVEVFADLPVDRSVPIKVVLLRAAGVLAWLLGFVAAVWLIGFLFAIPLFVTAFVLFHVRDRWWMALILGAAVGGLVYFLFDQLLRTFWPASVLFG